MQIVSLPRRPLTGAPALAALLLLGAAACQEDAPPVDPPTGISLTGDCAPGNYPRLVMCPNEVQVARSRMTGTPHAGMYQRVKTEAQKSLATPGSTYDRDTESRNAKIAKYAGLVAILERDQGMADKAADAITRLRSNWEFGLGLGSTDLFIHIVGYLQDGLEGFDLVLGSGLATARQRTSMEQALGAIARKLYQTWITGPGRLLVVFCQNNYNTKLSTSLGLAALMLDSHPDRAAWLRLAATESNRMYGDGTVDKNLYLDQHGVCKEPPGYFNFGGRAAMPFALLYEYMVGPEASYKNQCAISMADCADRELKLPGILRSERLHRAYQWMVKIQMPDGQRPSIDEGRATGPPAGGALWHHVNQDRMLLWDHVFASRGDAKNSPTWAGYYMARVDLAAAPRMVEIGTSQLFEQSGQVIFRSGWEQDAVWAAVLGEGGMLRSQVHNHADATSFQMYAFGEMLALDCGYFEPPGEDSVSSRAKTVGSEAHNLILVDGKGAPKPSLVASGDVDARMQGSFARQGLGFTEVLASYQGVSVARSVLFASERYLVVADAVTASAPHTYSWRLHGHGGGSSIRKNYEVGTFALGSDGPVWSRSRAKLMLVLDSTHGKPSYTSGSFPHEWKSSWEGYHTYVDGVVQSTAARPAVSFLAVVFPQRAGSDFPAIKVQEAHADSACITITGQGFADIMAAGPGGGSAEIAVSGFSAVRSDAALWWISLASDGSVKRALIKGGKTLSYGGKTLIDNAAGAATAVYPG